MSSNLHVLAAVLAAIALHGACSLNEPGLVLPDAGAGRAGAGPAEAGPGEGGTGASAGATGNAGRGGGSGNAGKGGGGAAEGGSGGRGPSGGATSTPDASEGDADAAFGPECSGTRADCNNHPDDGCETNTSNDAKNCGACGHDCLGGGCQFGECQPVPLSIHQVPPIELAQDGVNLYWAAGDHVVRAMPLGGGEVRTVTVSPDLVTDIATDGEYVYWITGNIFEGLPTVRRAKVDGADAGTPELLYQGVISGPIVELMTAVATDGQNVYWSLFDRDTGGAAYFKRAKNGSAAERVFPNSGYQPRAVTTTMQVSGNAIYAGGGGGGAWVLKIATNGSSFERLFDVFTDAGTEGHVSAVAVFGDTVYFTRILEGVVFGPFEAGLDSVPAAGGSSKHLSDHGMFGVAVDGANVYYATLADIARMPTRGGQSHLIAPNHQGVDLVMDSRAIYWAEGAGPPVMDGGPATESIWMLAK